MMRFKISGMWTWPFRAPTFFAIFTGAFQKVHVPFMPLFHLYQCWDLVSNMGIWISNLYVISTHVASLREEQLFLVKVESHLGFLLGGPFKVCCWVGHFVLKISQRVTWEHLTGRVTYNGYHEWNFTIMDITKVQCYLNICSM